eukprot:5624840-Amphidinium_carterae.2
MSESPELSGKRKWISEQRTAPPSGAQSLEKPPIHDRRTTDWHVVDVNDRYSSIVARSDEKGAHDE